MPTNYSGSQQVSGCIDWNFVGEGSFVTASTEDLAHWYVPPRPHSQGIVIRRVVVTSLNAIGDTATAWGISKNGTTDILTGDISHGAAGADASTAGTLADTGANILDPGDYVALDFTLSAGAWAATTNRKDVMIQVYFDWR